MDGNIKNIQGIDLGNGESAKVDLDIIQGKVLEFLSNNSLGIYASARVENPSSLKGGTIVYRVPELLQVKDYKKGNNKAQTPQVGTKLVNLDKLKTVKYELESFDIAGLTQGGEIESKIAQGIALAIQAHLDAYFFKAINEKVVAKEVITLPADNDLSNEKLRELRIKFIDNNTKLTTKITKQMIGANKSTTLTIASPKTYSLLLEGASLVGSEKGQSQILSGEIEGAKIGGFEFTNHFYIGQNIENVGEGADVDLSTLNAIILNKEAIAYPVDFVSINTRINGDGNVEFIQKLRYGFEIIRPSLISKITNA